MHDASKNSNILQPIFKEAISIALYLMGLLTLIGAYQEFTKSLNPFVLAFLFAILSVTPPLLIFWCMLRYRSQDGSAPSQLKGMVPILAGMFFLLMGLVVLLAPTYFDAFDRAEMLGKIYVDEHMEIIEADGRAMAIDLNRELDNTTEVFMLVNSQIALRVLSFGAVVFYNGDVVASSLDLAVLRDTAKQHVERAKNSEGLIVFVNAEGDAVVCVVELETAKADYLIIGRSINKLAVADWRKVSNYIGGSTDNARLWIVAASAAFVVLTTGMWWAARRDRKT